MKRQGLLSERDLPRRVGGQQLMLVIGLLFVLLVMMEVKARRDNLRLNYYPPSEDLWVSQWLELESQPADQLVVIGASRMQFGVIVPEWQHHTGVRPQMLAWPGSPPGPVLSKLAELKSFRGTVLCGFAPAFSFCRQDSKTRTNLQKNFKALEPSRYSLSHHLSLAARDTLLPRFKFMNSFAYSPVLLAFSNFPIANREGVLHPNIFPFAGSLDRELQFRFTNNVEQVMKWDIVAQIQESTRRNLAMVGPADADELVEQYKHDVATIEQRGGRVIFVRPPSDGLYYEFELQYYPRENFFDRIVKETGCLGIHFQDYPELRDFKCVEDSHLGVEQALDYTRQLINVLRREGVDI